MVEQLPLTRSEPRVLMEGFVKYQVLPIILNKMTMMKNIFKCGLCLILVAMLAQSADAQRTGRRRTGGGTTPTTGNNPTTDPQNNQQNNNNTQPSGYNP